jgi:hypothetical protein
VALVGSRGIPGRYGGYETLAEELAVRLVERGWRVTVTCRSHSTPRHLAAHRGVDLVVLPTLPTKYLDTPVHTLLAALDLGRRQGATPVDAALVVNSANALFDAAGLGHIVGCFLDAALPPEIVVQAVADVGLIHAKDHMDARRLNIGVDDGRAQAALRQAGGQVGGHVRFAGAASK